MNNTVEFELNNLNSSFKTLSRRKWMFRLATLLWVMFSLVFAVVVSIAKDAAINKAVTKYTESSDVDLLMTLYDDPKLRGNNEALIWYEENILGIKNNTALAGISRSVDYNVEEKNKIKDVEAFIDKKDRSLKVYKNGELVFHNTDEIIEVIATEKCVFYINQTDKNALYVYDLEEQVDVKLVDDRIVQFAMYGNRIIYLNRENELFRYSLETKETSKIANNVQRFFLSGNIIAQTEKSIVEIRLDGKKYEKIVDDALLVGASDDYMYFTNFGVASDQLQREIEETDKENEDTKVINIDESELSKEFIVYKYDIQTKEKVPVIGSDKLVRAVYENGEDLVIDTVD